MKAYEKLAEFYKKDWGTVSAKYADLVSNIINKYNIDGDSVLDVACGTGILASELKNRNFQVCGIDLSEEMIDVARKSTSDIRFEVADMREFNLNEKFNIITCAFDSINYITDKDDMKKTVDNVFNHLYNNGFFIFDINTPSLYEDKHFGTIDRVYGDIHFKQILEYDKENKIGKTVFDFGNNELETHIQRAYTIEEMDEFLLAAGFKIVGRYRNLSLSPVEERTYKVFYAAKKVQ